MLRNMMLLHVPVIAADLFLVNILQALAVHTNQIGVAISTCLPKVQQFGGLAVVTHHRAELIILQKLCKMRVIFHYRQTTLFQDSEQYIAIDSPAENTPHPVLKVDIDFRVIQLEIGILLNVPRESQPSAYALHEADVDMRFEAL